jgi:mannose-6-phosphate isomerase-like protein (cupin superfamily)
MRISHQWLAIGQRKETTIMAATSNSASWRGEFEGAGAGSGVSIIFTQMDRPGEGPALHSHPYPETFIVRQGVVTFSDGVSSFDAGAGQIVVVAAGKPHRFTGKDCPAEMLDIHASERFTTRWIDDPARAAAQKDGNVGRVPGGEFSVVSLAQDTVPDAVPPSSPAREP